MQPLCRLSGTDIRCLPHLYTKPKNLAARPEAAQKKPPSGGDGRLLVKTFFWSGRRDSNARHLPWQGSALPAELLPRGVKRKEKTPAPTYSSGMLPSKYHWRNAVSRPSSAWDGVGPACCEHGGICNLGSSSKLNGELYVPPEVGACILVTRSRETLLLIMAG